MTNEEEQLARQAKDFVKSHAKEIVARFADPVLHPPVDVPRSLFMAGSPGAGKTEVSKRLVESIPEPIVRIDADEVREAIPQYTRSNSDVIQGAAALGVEKIIDSVLKHKQHFILDGLLSKYEKAKSNIERCLARERRVDIFYVYQDPKVAWEFTKKREEIEGRHIPLEAFIEGFVKSRENALFLKKDFGRDIELHVIQKNFENDVANFWLYTEEIDKFIPLSYTEDDLKGLLL
ncbi:MAG: zeta toxin family protein [Patescibacteria group bacterium]